MKNLMFLTMLLGLMIIATDDVSAQKTNVALNKPTTQSSLYAASYPASRAVDGITTGRNPDFTHTKDEANPWWQVDLGAVYDVNEIVIWNRTDCCWERLQNYFVMLSETPITSNSTTKNVVSKGSFQQNQPNAVDNFGTSGKKGRYVRVFTQNRSMPLSLAEVQVFSYAKANPILKSEKSPEAKSLENNVIGYWGEDAENTLIFRQGEFKRYFRGILTGAFSYRVLDNSTVELTDKDGKKSLAKVAFFDNTSLHWDQPLHGSWTYKRQSQSETERFVGLVLNANIQGIWLSSNGSVVFMQGNMRFYDRDNNIASDNPYRVVDGSTVETSNKDGKKRLIKVISSDPAQLILDDPIYGKRVFKRYK